MLRLLADALGSVLLAPVCACCHEPLTHPTRGAVCARCWAGIRPARGPCCELCGDLILSWRLPDDDPRCPRCHRARRLIARGRSIGPYEGTLREILQALKYGGRRSLAPPLAAAMRTAGAAVLDGADGVVPVPLHAWRRWSRGFNQSRELAAHLGLPVLEVLRRVRATRTQTDLPEHARHANVRGAFALRSPVPAGCVLVLVDDVSTTGATLDACAAVLLAAGASEVRALTAARAAGRLL